MNETRTVIVPFSASGCAPLGSTERTNPLLGLQQMVSDANTNILQPTTSNNASIVVVHGRKLISDNSDVESSEIDVVSVTDTADDKIRAVDLAYSKKRQDTYVTNAPNSSNKQPNSDVKNGTTKSDSKKFEESKSQATYGPIDLTIDKEIHTRRKRKRTSNESITTNTTVE